MKNWKHQNIQVHTFVDVDVSEVADEVLRAVPVEMLHAEIKRRAMEGDFGESASDDWMDKPDAIKAKNPLMIMRRDNS